MQIILIFALLLPVCLAEHPYCFRFTWIGPYQDKEHITELNCQAIHQELNNVPCRQPLVATEHDTLPDTVALWQQHQHQPHLYGCPMTPGVSCVKYTYIYNKGVQNITYMCAKVNATEGCYRQRYLTGLEVSVCVCKSQAGLIPCNNANSTFYFKHIIVFFVYIISMLLIPMLKW